MPPTHSFDSALEMLIEMHGAPFDTIHDAIDYGLCTAYSAPNEELMHLMLEPVMVVMTSLGLGGYTRQLTYH